MNQSVEKSTFLIQSSKNNSFGTGFVVYRDKKGSYLVSCAHVVEECGEDVLMVENKEAQLLHVGSRDAIDLTLIYVEGLDSTALKLSDAMVGQGVLFEVYGFQHHLHGNYKLEMLKGSIKKLSALYSGSQKIDSYDLSIGRDDSIERGYSGSAILCPSSGDVIAVATSRYNDKHAEAIPIGYLKSIWQEMPEELLHHEPCSDMPKEESSPSTQNINIGDGNSNITVNQNIGLTDKTLVLIIKPYQDKIDELEVKLKTSSKLEEQLELSVQLEKVRKEKAQKDVEIAKLQELLDNAKFKIVKEAKEILSTLGVEKTLEFLQNSEAKEQEKMFQANMKEYAEKYRLEAQLLIVQNRYSEAKEAYKKVLTYERTVETLFDYALFLDEQNYFDEAIKMYEQLLLEQRALAKINSSVYNPKVADTLNNLGNLYQTKNQFQKVDDAYGEALELYRALVKTNSVDYYTDIARTLTSLGNLYNDTNQFQKAEDTYGIALEFYRALDETNPGDYNPEEARTLTSLGNLYSDTNQFQKAEDTYGEALEIIGTLAKTNSVDYDPRMTAILISLGNLYKAKNKIQKAEEAYDDALAIYRALAKINPSVYNSEVAGTLNNLAILYSDTNQLQKAEEAYGEALELYRALANNNLSVYGINLANSLVMGVDLLKQPSENLDEAEIILQKFKGNYGTKQLLDTIEELRKQ